MPISAPCFQSLLITYSLEIFLKGWKSVDIFVIRYSKFDVIRRMKNIEPIISINNIGKYPLHLRLLLSIYSSNYYSNNHLAT